MRRMSRRRVAGWLLCGLLAVHAVIAGLAARKSDRHQADFDNYYRIGTRSGRPYVDYQVEFPVGAVAALRTVAPMAGTRHRFGVLLVITNLAADAGIAAALAWGWGLEAAAGYAFVAAPILDLFLLRLDLWSTLFATIGIAAWRRDHRGVAAVAFVVGGAFKLWPLAFLPLTIAPTRRSRVLPAATAAAALVAVLGAWLWIAGPSGFYQVLTFRGAGGWEVESTVGSVAMLLDRGRQLDAGAWRVGTIGAGVSILLFAVGGAPCLWMIWRGARTGRIGSAWAGGISALLVCSALLSPQFAAWIAPASGVAWAERDTRIAVLVALAVFFSNLVFKSFVPLLHGDPGALVLLVVRNVLLIVVAIDAARLLSRADRAPAAGRRLPAPPPARST